MQLSLNAPQEALAALQELLPELLAEPCGKAPLTLTATPTEDAGFTLSYRAGEATLTYGDLPSLARGVARLLLFVREGRQGSVCERPIFITRGVMLDCSRNAVPTVGMLKLYLRKLAALGMNALLLYTEDTYEIEGRPYFGYMRGRYTREELCEIDGYAATLGIELIPCIQTLGHLATALRWGVTAPYRDTKSTLLVGAEDTYTLIGDMLDSIASSFRSRRVHIGMDETHDLGTGRALELYGYRERRELYLAHLARVTEMARARGLHPMMWSDMIFRMAGAGLDRLADYDLRINIGDEDAALLPRGVQQVFWDYYHPDYEFYAENIRKHRILGEDTVFAGGIWLFSGHGPLFSRTVRNTVPALDACRDGGVREVLATVWHNGSEAMPILSLAGAALYADYAYRGEYREEGVSECFRAATLCEYSDFLAAELPEHPHGPQGCLSRVLLYNDPLCGLYDRTVAQATGYRAYYTAAAERLEGALAGTPYAPAMAVLTALSRLLAGKADFGLRLREAYLAGDRERLSALAEECTSLREGVLALCEAHRAAWHAYHKPFGFEVHDLRYGGLAARFETARARILAYLSGEVASLPELLEERLRPECIGQNAPIGEHFLFTAYPSICTANVL